jgi:hypothetical protein
MPKYPVYDEESGRRFESADAAGRALFRRVDRRIERVEGMRIIRRAERAEAPSNRAYLRRRLEALYPLAYPGEHHAAD